MTIKISAEHHPAELLSAFQRTGRLQIPGFLTPESADYLHRLLQENQTWNLTYNEGDEHFESDLNEFARLQPAHKQRFMANVFQRASTGFQYLFNQYYITQAIELGEQQGHPMHAWHEFMNRETTLQFMRTLTGQSDVRKADAYASWYEPGHFLTEHDDAHPSHDRVAALVLGMTPNWNRNWGGHLAFFADDGSIEEAYMPSYNTLSIFLVPRKHAVLQIAPFAGARRTSYLSWLHR